MAVERRRLGLSAEHGFIKRDRQIEAQIAAIDAKLRMLADMDRHDRIAGLTAEGAGFTLALQPYLLALFYSSGDRDFEPLAARQADNHAATLHRIGKRDF